MKGILKALGRMLRSFGRTVWTKCTRTGKWMASIMSLSAAMDAGIDVDVGDDGQAAAVPVADTEAGLAHIRALASALANNRVEAEMLETVDERTFAWLSVLDADMLAKVLLAPDPVLRDHLKGRARIAGVVLADPDSVAAYQAAIERDNAALAADLALEGEQDIEVEIEEALALRA